MQQKDHAVFIVPTGIGAKIGGYAGDASQAARKLSETIPLIVNPNVVNAAVFSGINDKMLYTEGYAIDEFFKGNLFLTPSQNNKIGIIFDKAIPQNVLNIHINTINAVKTVYGIDIIGYETTNEPVGVNFSIEESGISSGSLKSPEALIKSGEALLKKGAQALAVICLFNEGDESEDSDYASGSGVDPVGGVEAIISHILTKELGVPTAHAPAFEDVSIPCEIVDPRAASEYITPTFLPCVLLGLKNAPLLSKEKHNDCISLKNIKALIMPCDCLGSTPVFKAIENKIPVLAVTENSTVLDITEDEIGKKNDIIKIQTYEQCIDFLEETSK